jgi:chemotaxis protein methyltransferase CheR
VLPELLERAQRACYPFSSLKLLPKAWRIQAFEHTTGGYCLRAEYRQEVEFVQQDVRAALPDGYFSLILCRNLVFTYFIESAQRPILERLLTRLLPGGALVVGHREALPPGVEGITPWPGAERLGIFRRG